MVFGTILFVPLCLLAFDHLQVHPCHLALSKLCAHAFRHDPLPPVFPTIPCLHRLLASHTSYVCTMGTQRNSVIL
ncbi:hypothetical protein F5148DRAFT_1265187 [Russula earlei]|uniref:Uncharacterized protein n=1 Tax=Russula earlei TaxID=71964 RepID=A0ACC0TTQ2_9AGAM|nr:hypothetical protein F5148DRAFT_1265187 [Russula earlei]